MFQGGLGNQMFQYGYYKMMLSRFPKLSYQFAYGNSHNGFELDKWFNVDMKRASLFWKLLFEIIYFLKIKGIIDLIVSEEQYPQKDGWFVAGYWQDKRYFKKIKASKTCSKIIDAINIWIWTKTIKPFSTPDRVL